MKNEIKFITDSGSDLTDELLNGRDIEILSMEIEINGTIRKLSRDINLKQMYEDMRNKSVYKTSQVFLETFLGCFEKYAKQDTPVIYIGLSSALSGTFSAASLAAQEIRQTYPAAEIEVIDSKCASLGYGRIVLDAYDMAQGNASMEEILRHITYLTAHTEHLFTVSSLEYLVRGGRLSAAAAAVAGTLNIKPIIHINEKGALVSKEKIRGDKKLKQRIVELVMQLSGGLENQEIYILHGDDIHSANELIGLIKEKTSVKRIVTTFIGCTIGAHSGPGTIGIVFLNPNK